MYCRSFHVFLYNNNDSIDEEKGIKYFYDKVSEKEINEPDKKVEKLLKNIYLLDSNNYDKIYRLFADNKVYYHFIMDNIEIVNKLIKMKDFESIISIKEIDKLFLSSCHNVVNVIKDSIRNLNYQKQTDYYDNILTNYDEYKEDFKEKVTKLFKIRCEQYINKNKIVDSFIKEKENQIDEVVFSFIKNEMINTKSRINNVYDGAESRYHYGCFVKSLKRKIK